jgi:hypothetical protein
MCNSIYNMRIAIHQPYIFPYKGYFDLIASVDRFVIGDDYQYIKGGYINRNYFPELFTFPLEKHSNYNKINECYFKDINTTIDDFQDKFPKLKAKRYLNVMQQNYCLSYNIALTLQLICKDLGIKTPFYFASTIPHGKFDQGIRDIVGALDGDVYINAPGGRKLYNQDMFPDFELRFIDTVPGPSILCEL